MERYFNTAGPCVSGRHYMMPPRDRVGNIRRLIDRDQFFILHAPNQSGKTTLLRHLSEVLNEEGKQLALYVDLEGVDGLNARGQAIPAIIESIGNAAIDKLGFRLQESFVRESAQKPADIALERFLRLWCGLLDKPLVLLLDEVDCLDQDALVSFMRQLSNGFINRDVDPFPASVLMAGVTSLNEYHARRGRQGTTGHFNVIADAITLRNFEEGEIQLLYRQHTHETGQEFEKAAVHRVFELTRGQPWLVNALALQAVDDLVTDQAEAITCEHIDAAKDILLKRRPPHFDSLMAWLREDRVRKVIETLMGKPDAHVDSRSNDFILTRDLGLTVQDGTQVRIANPIYEEVIPLYL